MRAYEYRHVIGFEETNLTGNVYYVNHLRWQGRCREMFVKEQAPALLGELAAGLALVTLHCSCDYLEEMFAFDEIVLRMTLGGLTQSRMTLDFEYWRAEQLVARGRQEIACMRRQAGKLVATPVPAALREALQAYA